MKLPLWEWDKEQKKYVALPDYITKAYLNPQPPELTHAQYEEFRKLEAEKLAHSKRIKS